MKVLVFGAGAVGGYLGGMLQHAGHEVTLVCRPMMSELVQKEGLTIVPASATHQPSFTVYPQTVTSLANLPHTQHDLVMLTMKSYDTNEAIQALLTHYPQPPMLLTWQNGIGIEEKFMKQFGANQVLAGSVTIPLTIPKPNQIVVEKAGRGVAIAPVAIGQPLQLWTEMLQKAQIETKQVANHHSLKWSKALLNMVSNATSAILNCHPRLVYTHPLSFALELAMLRETLMVMRRQQILVIDLPGSPARQLAWAVRWLPNILLRPLLTKLVGGGRGNKLPSFLIDLNAGKNQSEISYHQQAVSDAGKKLNIPTPVNDTLSQILLELVQGQSSRAQFAGNPEKLYAAVYSKKPFIL